VSLCVAVREGLIVVDAACEYLLVSKNELTALISQPSLIDLIAFDSTLYAYLLNATLLSFLSGHFCGRIIKTLGKS